MANVEVFNTGLTEAQLAEAFSRALSDYTDAQINAMFAGKQDNLTFDSTPTGASSNPVTSGGVYSALAAVNSAVDGISVNLAAALQSLAAIINSGAKNRLKMKQTSTTVSGVQITVNSDKSITLSGTNSSAAETMLLYDFAINNAADSFSGNDTPLDANTDYVCNGTDNSNARIQVIGYEDSTDFDLLYDDYESGVFNSGNYSYYSMRIVIRGGAVFDAVTIYPMVCLRSHWDITNSYQPYCPTTRELYEMQII